MNVQWETAGCSIPWKNESIIFKRKHIWERERKKREKERGSKEKRKEG